MGHENVFHDIFERKTSFKDYKISKLKKSKNWFWSKINNFPFCYFTRNTEKKIFFHDILERRNAFVDNKNKN